MVRPRRFVKSTVIALRIEERWANVVDLLQWDCTDVFMEGLQGRIKLMGNKTPAKVIEAIIQDKQDQVARLQEDIKKCERILKNPVKFSEKMIRVKDEDNLEWVIPEKEFDPKQHKLLEVVT